MKKLITIAFLVIGLSVSAQKFSSLFYTDTIDVETIQFMNKSYSVFVNKDNASDSIEIAPLIVWYKNEFKEKGVMLHGFWISKSVTDSITVYFNGKPIRMGECLSSVEDPDWNRKIYTTDGGDAKTRFVGITDKIIVGNKTYVAVSGSRGLLSAKITGFEKVTCEWYE